MSNIMDKYVWTPLMFSLFLFPEEFDFFFYNSFCVNLGGEMPGNGQVQPWHLLSVSKCTANLYCICLSIDLRYTKADAVQICGKFWDTQ